MSIYNNNHSLLIFALLALGPLLSLANPTTSSAFLVPPASPTITRSSYSRAPTPVALARNQAVSGGYGLYHTSGTQLHGKKKGGGAATPAAAKKVQVKLLQHVAGTGQAGDVVLVTPAFFDNKLRPKKYAKIISDEEVAKEQAENEKEEMECKAKAKELQDKINGMTVTITKKAGPDGQLFGGVGPKVVMEELKSLVGDDDFLDGKSVKISELQDENGKKVRGDIKHTGQFGAKIVLRKDFSANFSLDVQGED